ncbi:carboxypeptidase regulatory-like domain-containing protein [Streptococcus uberis]|nr:carboxypeptidase regulatory-like domain-containing protein [Streptococcus uberis]
MKNVFRKSKIVETERKSRVKLHKSGKSWVKTTLAFSGLLQLFKGLRVDRELSVSDEDIHLSHHYFIKGIIGIGGVIGAGALSHTVAADEMVSDLPLASETSATIATLDSAIITSQLDSSQSVSSEQRITSEDNSQTSVVEQSQFALGKNSFSERTSVSPTELSESILINTSLAVETNQSDRQTLSESVVYNSISSNNSGSLDNGLVSSESIISSLDSVTVIESNTLVSDSTLLVSATSETLNNPETTSLTPKNAFKTTQPIILLATGTVDNSLITVTSQSYLESGTQDGIIDPFVMEYLKHTVNFSISNTATAGDQFAYTFGTYVAPDDLNIKQYVPDPITDASGQIIATAAYNQTTKTITYTFTDYVDKYTDVTASMTVVNLIDRGTVPNSTTVTASSTFASAPAATKSIKVQYSNATKINGTSDLSGMLNYRDKINNTIEEIFYVNPLDYISYNYYSSLDIYGYDVNTGISGSDYINSSTIIEVYKVPSTVALPTSMRITDYSLYTKITPTISYGTDMATISNLSTFNGETYLVRVVAKYDPANTDPIKISGVMTSYDYYGSGYTATVVNGLKSTSGSSTGTGTLVTYKIGNYVWQDNDKDGLQGTSSTEKPFANVKVTLTFADGTTKSVFTDAIGYYQFDGLLDGQTYTVSFETPAGWLPTISNVGTNDAVDSDGSSITVSINGADNMTLDTGFYQGPSLIASTSTSTSKSTSDSAYSDSVSKSTSTSVVNDSVSKSTSDSVKSDSISKSTSTSIVSESVSRSTSDSVKSDSISKSTSDSVVSDSISKSTSDSVISDSISKSISLSQESDSVSRSTSNSQLFDSLSQSTSLSQESDSVSRSTSNSQLSDSLSQSTSLFQESDSVSRSTSNSQLSDSLSQSTSLSQKSDSVSRSTSLSQESDSISKSTSLSQESDSVSRSTSASQESDSLSQSTSLSQESDSISQSTSESAYSDSVSQSISMSEESDSISQSTSESAYSDSVSQSISLSEESDSISQSTSESAQSDSVSRSISVSEESDSISQSKSTSAQSESLSQSTSMSQESDSLSQSNSTVAQSESLSQSTSMSQESDFLSQSTSDSAESDSLSQSTSLSEESNSLSQSTSQAEESDSISRSTSMSAESDSLSQSTSDSAESDSLSQSTSMSLESDSISRSTSESIASDSNSYTSQQSDSLSQSISLIQESDSLSRSLSASEESDSLSQSTSLVEENDSTSRSTSASVESDSLSQSDSQIEESISLSQSTSASVESDSLSQSTSIAEESDSTSRSTSASVESDSLSQSTSIVEESDSQSRSASASVESDSLSQSTSIVEESDSQSRSTSVSIESDFLSQSTSVKQGSESLSDSKSLSQESDSVSQSTSVKQESESLSDSKSLSQESDSVSQSTSVKQESESLSDSRSLSQESDSVSQSTSEKQESESLSDSKSLSQESDSVSQSTSEKQESESISDSVSLAKESDSVSQSLSNELEYESISSSESLSQESSSISESLSITVHSESVSQSESLSQESESISESLYRVSNSISVSNSDSSSLSTSISQSQSTIGSEAPKVYAIGDFVWEDTNKDGIQDAGEPGIPGVTVTLKNPDGSTKTTTTDSNGYYEFTELNDGDTYTVTFETPKGYKPTVANIGDDSKDSDGASVTVTINGANDITLDSGFVRDLHTIGDTVWEDSNKDGVQDSGEPGIPDVIVTLTNPDGTTVTTSTDANGHYEFTDLPDGDYTVTFETPKGYNPTTPNTGDDTKDSDGQVVKVTVAGSDNPTIDSGFVKKAYTIGDYVWEDTNKNGIQDAGEPGIPGVTVTLTYPIGSTVTTTTDANGYYEFKNLNDGETYIVTFETPKGYAPTIANTGDDAKDSDGSSVSVTIKGADDITLDSGFVKVHTIGDTVWEDSNKDGVQDSGEPGIPGVTVTLTNPDGSTETTTTDEKGHYEFTDLPDGDYTVTFETPDGYTPTTPNTGDDTKDSDGQVVKVTVEGNDNPTIDSGFVKETYTIGDYVWEDTSKDGIQDAGEPGIPGVNVTITYPDGSTKTTSTDSNGYYEFTELNDGDTYTVTFETPDGYKPTVSNNDDDSKDSDGATVTVTINGADDLTLDSGFVKDLHTIGDTVWEDTDKDGTQDAGEPGIPGVTVILTNPDGSTETTTTDENGHYEFTDLPNGDYTVTFETPNGYTPTTSNTGDDTKDSDGQVVKVTVDGSDNPTIDSGFVKEVHTIGDTVWEDTNKDGIQDAGEPGIPGVTVTLTNPDGTTVTTRTDANGHYEFTELPNGDYTVTFETPDGYTPTTSNTGDDTKDSDGQVVKVTVDGSDNPTIDSGFVKVEQPTPGSNSSSESLSQSTTQSSSQSSSAKPVASQTAAQLPHTGQAENNGLYGSAALAILAALGLAGKKRNEND